MRREISYLSVVAVAAPLAVSAPPQHATEVTVSGGTGSYASIGRGCNGEVLSKYPVDLKDAAVEASHKFPGPWRLGARAGVIDLESKDPFKASYNARYVNPYLSLDWPSISLGVGYFRANHPLPETYDDEALHGTWNHASGHVRFGRPNFYFSAAYLEEMPIAAAGDVALGFGKAWRKSHVWLGTGAIPFDHFGLVAKADFRIAGGLAVGGTGRLGSSQGVSENTISLRISYLMTRADSARTGY
jgi:hypothetical protein